MYFGVCVFFEYIDKQCRWEYNNYGYGCGVPFANNDGGVIMKNLILIEIFREQNERCTSMNN